jgi:UrcA family protein
LVRGRDPIEIQITDTGGSQMNAITRIAFSRRPKTATSAFALLALCAIASTPTFADNPSVAPKATERGIVSLAGLDVLTPEGVHAANVSIYQMARRLCMQLVNLDDRDAATCVDNAVADAQQRLNAVIQARLAQRSAHAVASKSKN